MIYINESSTSSNNVIRDNTALMALDMLKLELALKLENLIYLNNSYLLALSRRKHSLFMDQNELISLFMHGCILGKWNIVRELSEQLTQDDLDMFHELSSANNEIPDYNVILQLIDLLYNESNSHTISSNFFNEYLDLYEHKLISTDSAHNSNQHNIEWATYKIVKCECKLLNIISNDHDRTKSMKNVLHNFKTNKWNIMPLSNEQQIIKRVGALALLNHLVIWIIKCLVQLIKCLISGCLL